MAVVTGDVSVQPGSAVGRLGEDAAAAEAAAAVSRDPNPAPAADPAPATDKPTDTAKPADDAARAAAIADAEKAVAEAKTPEEKTAAEAKLAELKGEKPKAEGAPEKYEDFKLPEGVKLDEAAMSEALPVFKEMNLTQAQAQRLIDLQAKFVQSQADKAIENWNAHLEATTAAAKADKEVGGANWDQNLAHAKAFIKAFGTPALQEYLSNAEAGSHVEIIRAFAKAGKAVSEDGFLPGSAPVAQPKSLAERMFPSMKPG